MRIERDMDYSKIFKKFIERYGYRDDIKKDKKLLDQMGIMIAALEEAAMLDDGWMHADVLCNALDWGYKDDFTNAEAKKKSDNSRITGIVRKWRRIIEKCTDQEFYACLYVISGRSGYKLPYTDEDFINFYKREYLIKRAKVKRVKSLEQFLQSRGVDTSSIKEELQNEEPFYDADEHLWFD